MLILLTMSHYENIIIGGGPAGLQMAYFLQKRNESYLLLDRSNSVGSFFKTFPRTRSLISVNKIHTFPYRSNSLRFDWNSLICDDESLRMSAFSKDFYPDADDLIKYMEAFVKRYNLNISYECNVGSVRKYREEDTDFFKIKIPSSQSLTCRRLFVATGVQSKKVPDSIMQIGRKMCVPVLDYGSMSLNPELYLNKCVFIIGTGNAAFEVANYLNDFTQSIALCGPAKPAWKTHYPGNLRSVNMTFLDTFYLKVGNVIYFDYDASEDIIYQYDEFLKSSETQLHYIIYCGGFEANMSFLQNEMAPKCDKGYPILTPYYESINIPNLFFIGTLMQQHDYKRGTSAFIHGFRYNIEFLDRWLHDDIKQVYLVGKNALIDHIMYRMKHSTNLYHRFGMFMDHIIVLTPNNNNDNTHFLYTEGIPNALSSLHKSRVTITITFDYLPFTWELRQPDILVPTENKTSVYLHPIVHIHREQHVEEFHVGESITGEFIHPIHRDMFDTYIEYALSSGQKSDLNKLRNRVSCIEEKHETNQYYKRFNGFDIDKLNNKMTRLMAASIRKMI